MYPPAYWSMTTPTYSKGWIGGLVHYEQFGCVCRPAVVIEQYQPSGDNRNPVAALIGFLETDRRLITDRYHLASTCNQEEVFYDDAPEGVQ